MLGKFSGFNPKGPYQSLEKEKGTFCVVFTYSLNRALGTRKSHIAVVHGRQRNVRVMHVGSCCFANRFFFWPFSLLSPSSLINIGPIAVIQKNGHHGSLTSHFSSLIHVLCEIKLFL